MKYRFYYCDNEWLRNGFSRYELYLSQQFCEYFSEYFESIFFSETGLKPSTKVTLAGYKQQSDVPIYEPGSVSKLNLVLWIMPEYNDNISFCWKSKTGKIIKPTDEHFDEEDLECWIEGLKPNEYWAEVATEKKMHPFQIANLPFDLKVFGFGVDMELRIHALGAYDKLKSSASKTIETYNHESESFNRKNGVVHNYQFIESDDYLGLRIDTGSAGIEIIKKLLKGFAKITGIEKVEIDI